jgi:hypothetical protein
MNRFQAKGTLRNHAHRDCVKNRVPPEKGEQNIRPHALPPPVFTAKYRIEVEEKGLFLR